MSNDQYPVCNAVKEVRLSIGDTVHIKQMRLISGWYVGGRAEPCEAEGIVTDFGEGWISVWCDGQSHMFPTDAIGKTVLLRGKTETSIVKALEVTEEEMLSLFSFFSKRVRFQCDDPVEHELVSEILYSLKKAQVLTQALLQKKRQWEG